MFYPVSVSTMWLALELGRSEKELARCNQKIAEYDAAPFELSRLYVDTWRHRLLARITGLRAVLALPSFTHAPYVLYLFARDLREGNGELRDAAMADCDNPTRGRSPEGGAE